MSTHVSTSGRTAEQLPPRSPSLWGTPLARLFDELRPGREVDGGAGMPGGRVSESESEFCIEFDLPGVDEKDITIDVTGRRVTVQGERRIPERDAVLRQAPRLTGRFHVETVLPLPVEEPEAHGELDHGVLTLHLPKAAATKSRRIPIT